MHLDFKGGGSPSCARLAILTIAAALVSPVVAQAAGTGPVTTSSVAIAPLARADLLSGALGADEVRKTRRFDGPASPPGWFAPGHGQPAFALRIPSIGLRQVVVEGADQAALAGNPGHYPECGPEFPPPFCTTFDATWPGERGRVVIGGHRTLATAPFFDLGEMRRGDQIIVNARWGRFLYRVTHTRLVAPTDRTIIVPGVGGRQLVLVTCHPKFSAAQRLIVFAGMKVPRPPQREVSTHVLRPSGVM